MGESIVMGLKHIFSKDNFSRVSSVAQDFVDGQMLARAYFLRHLPVIVLLAVCSVVYISSRYTYNKKMRDRRELELTLDSLQFVHLNVSAEYMEKSRESKLEDIIRETLPELQVLRTPAVEIIIN